MSLAAGARIGPYEVQSPLGQGGMGEVYRARDIRLDRPVALKVLPAAFADDPERLRRFEREARILAALSHPNIAQVYSVEGLDAGTAGSTAGGTVPAIAMELVEGETLADRLRARKLPLDEALDIGRQIAEALEAAHDAGVVHRDLKPSNVVISDDGVVKVLDFGLAKIWETAVDVPSGGDESPTVTSPDTRLGVVLGTAAYMAPEQARGRQVDRRADTFAFGAVLFEMLAGRRAFGGDEISDVLAAVLKDEPEWSALPASTPGAVRRLLRRCLEKDRRRRLREVGDAMRDLDPGDFDDARSSRAGTSWPVAGGAALVAAGLTLAVTWSLWGARSGDPTPREATRFVLSGRLAPTAAGRELALSRDGRTIVFTSGGTRRTPRHLRLRRLDAVEDEALAGTDGGRAPFVSPDGTWVGFVRDLTFVKKSLTTGFSEEVAHLEVSPEGADWGSDGIVFGTSAGLFEVSADGGVPTPITAVESGERAHAWPEIVPDSDLIVFVIVGDDGVKQLAAWSRASRRTQLLGLVGTNPQYLSTGHLLFVTDDGTAYRTSFDASTRTVGREPTVVASDVEVKQSGAAHLVAADDRTLVFVNRSASGRLNGLAWVERDGSAVNVPVEEKGYFYARVSPDGRQVALDERGGESDIWIWSESLQTLRRLASDIGGRIYPHWTHDGREIVYSESPGPGQRLAVYRRPAEGTGQPVQVAASDVNLMVNAVLAGDEGVLVHAQDAATSDDIWLISADGRVEPLLNSAFDERNAALSPDGRWMAYQTDESGRQQVVVRPFPDVGSGIWRAGGEGGRYPVWSPSGDEIFFLDLDDQMMAWPVRTVPSFESLGPPVRLFDASTYFLGASGRNFDVAPDGRLLMVTRPLLPNGEVDVGRLTVMMNWYEGVGPGR